MINPMVFFFGDKCSFQAPQYKSKCLFDSDIVFRHDGIYMD